MPPVTAGRWKLAHDPRRARTVWFSNNPARAETWEWDGNQWHRQNPKVSPPSRQAFVLDYSPDLGGVVVHGGFGANASSVHDTWLWDGNAWTDLRLPLRRGRYAEGPMTSAYDVARQRWLVFFNASASHYWVPSSNAWQLRDLSLRASQPYPRLGERFDFTIDLARTPNQLFVLALALSPRPGIPLRWTPRSGPVILPLAPDPLLWLSLQVGLITSLDASGKGRIPFVVPNDPALLWLEFHAAGWTLDPARTVGAITNRAAVLVTK